MAIYFLLATRYIRVALAGQVSLRLAGATSEGNFRARSPATEHRKSTSKDTHAKEMLVRILHGDRGFRKERFVGTMNWANCLTPAREHFTLPKVTIGQT